MGKSATPLPKSATPLRKSATPLPKSATPLPKSATPLPKSATPLLDSLTQVRETYFEVVGGGGQRSPGFQRNPYPKLKTPRIWPTIFGRDPDKNKNERLSQSVCCCCWGGAPTASKLWGQVAPTAPPPRLPRSCSNW